MATQQGIMIFLDKKLKTSEFQSFLEKGISETKSNNYKFHFTNKKSAYDKWIEVYTNELVITIENETVPLELEVYYYPKHSNVIDTIDLNNVNRRGLKLMYNYLEPLMRFFNKSIPNCNTVVSYFPEFDDYVDLELYNLFKNGKLKQTKIYKNSKIILDDE